MDSLLSLYFLLFFHLTLLMPLAHTIQEALLLLTSESWEIKTTVGGCPHTLASKATTVMLQPGWPSLK